MFDHHATHVLLDLAHLCVKAMRFGSTEESLKIAKLSEEISKLFPEADTELHDRYPINSAECPEWKLTRIAERDGG